MREARRPSDHSAIAVVGMSCRLPLAPDPPAFWRLLADGRQAVGEIPDERLELTGHRPDDALFEGDPGAGLGAFLDHVDRFDAELFGISPREAAAMDPQQRLALELAWEALEDAGTVPDAVRGGAVGVYLGAMAGDYANLLQRRGGDAAIDRYAVTGLHRGMIANRVSHVLGLTGPSMTVDAGQSSSLVAVDLACERLRSGEVDLALAGGVHLNVDPRGALGASRFGGLSPDGRCFTFDARANGYARGEGGGIVALKRLAAARAAGDRVYGAIAGCAVTNDGPSEGLTVPSRMAQEDVLRRAYGRAGLDPSEAQYVELHGTATAVGDPIEAAALGAVLGVARQPDDALAVGSAKTNVGHLEGAAGIVGLIKALLAIDRRQIPASLNFETPNPAIPLDALRLRVQAELGAWPHDGRPLVAGVSSFGMGGTNVHVVLEEAPGSVVDGAVGVSAGGGVGVGPVGGVVVLALSARSEPALREVAGRLRSRLVSDPGLDVVDVGFSLAATRSVFERRAVVVGGDRGGLVAALGAVAEGGDARGVVRGVAAGGGGPVFVFPGQGGQWAGMAVELLEASPVFARHVGACEEALEPYVDWSLREVLGDRGGGWLDRLDVLQPVLFAVTVSLARLWRELGVEPAAVVGHSQGEIAAAHVAGALTLDDAARVVALRGRAVAGIAGRGGMAAVTLPLEGLLSRLEPFGERLSLAAANGPVSQVVSGDPGALEQLLAACESDGVRAQRIAVDYAAHSGQVEALRDELLEAFAPISPCRGDVPFHSTVTGAPLDTDALDAEYWYRNLREPVRLEPVVRSLLARGGPGFLEIGPHPVLGLALRETVDAAGEAADVAVLSTLRREDGGPGRFALSLAAAHAAGVDVDWRAFFAGAGAKRVPLPTYPFQRRRFWRPSADGGSGGLTSAGLASADHPLLGAAVALPHGEGWLFTGRLSLEDHPWLGDHAIGGSVLLPGTAFLDLAMHVARIAGLTTVDELTLEAPLALPESAAIMLRVWVGAVYGPGARQVAISSRPEGGDDHSGTEWTRHATGSLSRLAVPAQAVGDVWPPAGSEPVEIDGVYDRLASLGYDYGAAFRRLTAVWRHGADVFAEVRLDHASGVAAGRFAIHPALLDAALQAGVAATLDGDEEERIAEVPFSWAGTILHARGARALRVKVSPAGEGAVSLSVLDAAGMQVAEIGSLRTRPFRSPEPWAGAGAESLSEVEWVRLAAGEPRDASAIDDGASAVDVVSVAPDAGIGDGTPAELARIATQRTLARLQAWLADERSAGRRLVLVTRGAVAVREGETADLAAAPLWGVLRSARSEHPGRFAVVDVDGTAASQAALRSAVRAGEDELALRDGAVLVPRLAAVRDRDGSLPRLSRPWRLDAPRRGALDALAIVADARASSAPLGPGEVRIAMRAAGLNFRDVMLVLGFDVPGDGLLGSEGAGVVVEAGSDVTAFVPGDRVMGLVAGALGSLAVGDGRLLAPIPRDWSFEQAAAVPAAFLTARYALVDLAGLAAGERVLIHAGAGGVGMAAIQLARRLGAEVFATASPSKWEALHAAGVGPDRVASSRDLGFRESFTARTGGRGFDVVLNSLANEFVDASLDLLADGGRFVEMGKTDVRDPERVADARRGVSYRAFDLIEAGPDRLGAILAETIAELKDGDLQHVPTSRWEIGRAADACRHLRAGRNVGKLVLDIPGPIARNATVLITGGTGGLGGLVARHLARRHGVRHLLLASRRGPEAEGAAELRADLERTGAEVAVVACDVGDRDRVAELLDAIPARRPLDTVVHAAGVLDDDLLGSLTPGQVDRVFAPKVDGAWHLHDLTQDLDLSRFVMFSSVAGVLGSPGQANYAAANAFLDALAQRRHAMGLPATSLAWGLWERRTGMTSHVGGADTARLARGGVAPLSDEDGLALLDAALGVDRPVVLAASLARRRAGALGLSAGEPTRDGRAAPADASLRRRIAALPGAEERRSLVLEAVRAEAAAVLGDASAAAAPSERTFKELGLESLGAVELRNRLETATGLALEATVAFDHPSPGELADHLLAELTVAFDSASSG